MMKKLLLVAACAAMVFAVNTNAKAQSESAIEKGKCSKGYVCEKDENGNVLLISSFLVNPAGKVVSKPTPVIGGNPGNPELNIVGGGFRPNSQFVRRFLNCYVTPVDCYTFGGTNDPIPQE